jgi:hypothetical protein
MSYHPTLSDDLIVVGRSLYRNFANLPETCHDPSSSSFLLIQKIQIDVYPHFVHKIILILIHHKLFFISTFSSKHNVHETLEATARACPCLPRNLCRQKCQKIG